MSEAVPFTPAALPDLREVNQWSVGLTCMAMDLFSGKAYIHPASLSDIANKTVTPRPDPKCALRVCLPKLQKRLPDFKIASEV